MSPESGMSSSFSSAVTTPKTGTSPRTGDDSTTKLLRHLQGRVQQLRAQNENLRKSSDDSLNDSQSSIGNLSLDTTVSLYNRTRLPRTLDDLIRNKKKQTEH